MPRDLTPERSFTDRKQILGVRWEMIGWAVLVLAGLLWMMRGTIVEHAAMRPSATAQNNLNPGDGQPTNPATNETERRLDLALLALAVVLAAAAQVAIILGASVQIGTKPRDLWMRLALPFLFILIPQGGSQSRRGHTTSDAVWLFSPRLFLALLAASVVPALLVVWLMRRSKASHHSNRSRNRRSERET